MAVCLAAMLVLTGGIGCARLGCSPAQKPLGSGATGRLAVMAFYENGDTAGTSGVQGPGDNEQTFVDSFPALKANSKTINVVVPFWFSLGGDGSVVTAKPVAEVQKFAKDNKIQVWALVNNAKTGDQPSSSVLTDPTARANAVKNIVGVADKYGYEGIFIDFQLIQPNAKASLTAMVQQLAKELHAKKKKLGVALFPKIDVSPDISGAYDYKALAAAADIVLLMAYDRHYEGSPPGAVSPMPWVESNLKNTLTMVPANKLVLAIGTYGYDWTVGGNGEYIASRVAINRADKYGATIKWDDATGQPYFTYADDQGQNHEVWFQNAESARLRIGLAKQYKLAGIGVWRLGFEEEGFWKVVAENIGPAKK